MPEIVAGSGTRSNGVLPVAANGASAHLSPKIQVGKIPSHVNRPRLACTSGLPQISIPYVSPTWFTTRWVFGIVAEVLGMDLQTETTPTVQRISGVIALAEEGAEEYVRLHAAVWPEVLDALRRANVTNYSIFRRDYLLFSYMEYRGSNLVADMGAMARDTATKRWWEVVMPLQRTMRSSPDEDWWAPMEEVFHLD
jgi:L-rhamnose mutarotase